MRKLRLAKAAPLRSAPFASRLRKGVKWHQGMYRYLANKYTKSLLALGAIRVGTLHDFRRSEHKRGVADPQEGKKEVFHPIEELHITDPNSPEVRAIEQFGIFNFGNEPTNMKIQGLTIARSFDEPDCFILCPSKVLSKNTMLEFEDADSCYEISNPNEFYRVLTETLNSFVPVVFLGVYEVIYQDKKEQWNGKDWGHHPALIKEPEFKNQSEIRAIWQPRFGHDIKPLIIANYRLIASCKELTI